MKFDELFGAPEVYAYYYTRPITGPGSIPGGATSVEHKEFNTEDAGGHFLRVFGIVEYDRELTDDEMSNYDLIWAEGSD